MIVLRAFYLVVPVVLAGVLHAVVLKRDLFSGLARPLDASRGVLGPNKTWRGVAVMVVGSTAAVLAQRFASLDGLALVDYQAPMALLIGPALGLGYCLAELPNSFAKRRLGIAPGERTHGHSRLQYIADQGDSVVGATIALVPFVREPGVLLLVAVLGFLLHAAFDRLLYFFHVKQVAP
jgi:hypothetical protein